MRFLSFLKKKKIGVVSYIFVIKFFNGNPIKTHQVDGV